jgi:hypothetical protein
MRLGPVLLVSDSLWFFFWVAVMFYVQCSVMLQGSSGIPYRTSHRWQMIHFLTGRTIAWNVLFTPVSDAWLSTAVLFGMVFADLSNVLEVALHIPTTVYEAWVLEMIGVSLGFAITCVTFMWLLITYLKALNHPPVRRPAKQRLLL